jgi:nitroreductase
MTAETSTPINSLIAERRSPRSLNASAEISDVDLRASLEAARWAPSAFNGQPWRFFVGRRGDATFTQILSSLGEFNQMWAKNASALILVAGKDTKSDGTQHPSMTVVLQLRS